MTQSTSMPATAMPGATRDTAVDGSAIGGRTAGASLLRVLRPLLMIGGVVAVAAGALHFWLAGGRYVSIDDAYVRAAKVALSTDVSGIVTEVAVHEGERVHKGQVLLRLDPKQFQYALLGARANLAQTELMLRAMERDYQRMLHDADARQAQVQSDQSTADRLANLVRAGGVTRQDADDARFKLLADQQTLEALRVQAEVQLAKLGGDATADVKTLPQYLQAQAQVDEAQRQMDHSVITAPFDGIATQVDSVQPGMYLAASTAAFAIVSSDRIWAEGYPKETELTFARPGDPVEVTIDTYPGRTWTGRLESIAPASGSEFSVLPAQNSSGNWVKVVQRIPVRVSLNRTADGPDLRAGMSVVISIDTGHVRNLGELF
jgi:membrane fusion protein (multidrug efflux system)